MPIKRGIGTDSKRPGLHLSIWNSRLFVGLLVRLAFANSTLQVYNRYDSHAPMLTSSASTSHAISCSWITAFAFRHQSRCVSAYMSIEPLGALSQSCCLARQDLNRALGARHQLFSGKGGAFAW